MEELLEVLCHTADGAYVIDDQHRIILWNEAAEAILGYTAEEVKGRLCYEVIAGQDERGRLICRDHCRPFVASGRRKLVPNFDILVRTKQGETRWINVSIIAVPGSGDKPRAIIHLFRDINAKKQAEAFAAEIASRVQQLEVPQPAFSPSLSNSAVLAANNVGPMLDDLTRRELQVLELLAGGADTIAIANELMISETTVRNHIQRILRKLGVHSRLEAVASAREHGLIP